MNQLQIHRDKYKWWTKTVSQWPIYTDSMPYKLLSISVWASLFAPRILCSNSYAKYCEGSNASKPRHSQFSSVTQSYPTLCDSMTAARQASLSVTSSQSLFKLMSIESAMPSSHLILCHPILLLLSIFPSVRVFSKESVLRIRWPTYWSFSFSIGPSNEYSGLISFMMDWLDLLAVQGILKSLLQNHSSKIARLLS